MISDSLFVDLVIATNAGGPRIPVALLVGGGLVTGSIADARDYADAHPTVPTFPASTEPNFVHLADVMVNGQALGWWRLIIERVDGFSLPVFSAQDGTPLP